MYTLLTCKNKQGYPNKKNKTQIQQSIEYVYAKYNAQ